MANLDRKSVDLFLTEDGDLLLDETLGDVKNTKEMDYRCIQQTLVMRMENSQEDFGIDMTPDSARIGIQTLFGRQSNIFASLDDFHGEKLNSQTLELIKTTVSNCLNDDYALSRIPHVVSVIKKDDTVVSILIALKIMETLPNGKKAQAVITYNGMYNTYSKDFRMYSMIGT